MTFAYNYFLFSSVFNAAVATVFGLIIFFKNPKSPTNRLFAFFCLAFCAWSYPYIGWPVARTIQGALLSFQLLHIGASFVSITYLHFVIKWLNLESKKNKIILIIGYVLSAFFAFNTFSPLFIADMKPIFSMRFWAVPGLLYHFYLLMFFSLFFYASYLLYINEKKTIGIKKKQIQFVLIGMVLAFLGGSTNYFLWYGINIPPYGNLLAASFVIFTAYAIIKYRFADIRVAIRRSAVFTVLVLLITSIYALFAYLISVFSQDLIGTQSIILNGIITAILVAIGFEPLKKGLSEITDTFLFKAEYKPQEVMAAFSDKLSSTLNLNELAQFLVKKTGEVFKCAAVSLFLFDPEAKIYKEEAYWGRRSPNSLVEIDQKVFSKIFTYLRKLGKEKEIIVREEVKKLNEQAKSQVLHLLIKQLEEQEVNLVVPFFAKEELAGILFLGDKKSGDAYTQQDLEVLNIIAGQAAVSIKNAGLFQDIKELSGTLQQKVEEQTSEIVKKNKKLERLLKIKSEFLDIASHQLRTPVSVINGTLSMFKDGTLDQLPKEKRQTFINNAFEKGRKLNSIINDILNASDMDEEGFNISDSIEKLDFSQLILKLIDYSRQEISQKKIKLNSQVAPEIYIMGNVQYLEQAIGNLIDNAIKYSKEGGDLEINLSLNSDKQKLLFKIKDSGIGIPAKEQKNIFGKFARASNAKELYTDGSGLGLFIVKKIIDSHSGGKIWFESEENKGATFFIELPITK